MTTERKQLYPECFGVLKKVFPMGDDGLRHTPQACLPCVYKTECLRHAMDQDEGLAVREETVDRAYASGLIGFWQRWSRKKNLQRRMAEAKAFAKGSRRTP